MEEVINDYRKTTDEKYSRVLTRFPRAYTHPRRNMETELGDLMAEGMRESLGADLVLLSSGGIRKPALGPIVTLMDFMETFPFKNPMYAFKLNGTQLRHAIRFMLRDEAFVEDTHCEWYQMSRGFFCEYDRPTRRILSLKMNGKELSDDDMIIVVMESYHFKSIADFLDVRPDEIEKNGKPMEVATNGANVLQEYFNSHEHLEIDGEQRLVIHE